MKHLLSCGRFYGFAQKLSEPGEGERGSTRTRLARQASGDHIYHPVLMVCKGTCQRHWRLSAHALQRMQGYPEARVSSRGGLESRSAEIADGAYCSFPRQAFGHSKVFLEPAHTVGQIRPGRRSPVQFNTDSLHRDTSLRSFSRRQQHG